MKEKLQVLDCLKMIKGIADSTKNNLGVTFSSYISPWFGNNTLIGFDFEEH
jgi:hypothetical protein